MISVSTKKERVSESFISSHGAAAPKLTCKDKYNQCDDGPPILDLARRQRIAVALSHVDDGGFVEQDRDEVMDLWLKFNW